MPRFVLREKGRLEELPLAAIQAGPYQPRARFQQAALEELAESIRVHGVLQPILVRRLASGRYEIIAGERRLRAARIAGLESIPALVTSASDEAAAAASMVENLQRADLDPFEEAEGLYRLLHRFRLTQEEVAHQIGKSQASVANKVRLLKLDPRVRPIAREGRLTERHLRALLAIPSGDEQVALAQEIVERGLTVSETEARVGRISREMKEKTSKRRQVGVIRDLRIFLNAFRQATSALHQVGVPAEMEEREEGDYLVVTVRIPRGKS